ncbi:alpha/beta hydrolase [Pullulanibacillus sp. KACC 23026]|uniref:alpha/beta hydrolase n=1 Tax=Pullulanibacillus sp. KACC 23026 TaxID=3028315 RepID=UPI0023AF018C|nr:alpha/beta hydrolase [Pullulanibacillus sp. KACC 23026]WEG13302.1 alpha/beta hydrolase [Pullulanibacillus sp. KACC 23026]
MWNTQQGEKKNARGSMKTDKKLLSNLNQVDLGSSKVPDKLKEAWYSFNADGFKYDYVYMPSKGKRLFVLLSGFADRKKLEPPVFQRWTWSSIFPGHCLYIADPILSSYDNLGIGWYIGNKAEKVILTVAELIKESAQKLGIPLENVVLYASSGGGFASLQLSALIPELTAIVINPQIDVTKYDNRNVEKLLNTCFDGMTREEAISVYESRFSVLPLIDKIKGNQIFYVQNKLDSHHYEVHFGAFAEKIGLNEANGYKKDAIEVFFFEDPKGHAVAEPAELVNELMGRIRQKI